VPRNRDASLVIANKAAAAYYEKIFLRNRDINVTEPDLGYRDADHGKEANHRLLHARK
jgi:hypothetical protein